MSAFRDLVVNMEVRKLGARHQVLPTIERGPYLRREEPDLRARALKYAGLFLVLAAGLNYDFGILESQTFLVKQSTPGVRLSITLAVAGLLLFLYRAAFRNKADALSDEIIADRQVRAERLAAEEEKKAAAAAEEARQRALVVIEKERAEAWAAADAARQRQMQQERAINEQKHRERAVFEFRTNALKQMEEGLKQVLYDYRKREEWVPESADEEHLYKKIRLRIKQANVPEFGILRRSTDMTVTMVLGDRKCLPEEPSDELLARRQLPPVFELLGPRG